MATLQLLQISKLFPGVKALDNVSLAFLPGEIHALCGENGAGKSTLMNILAGNLQPDVGEIIINGKAEYINKPQDGFKLGISIVYQHLSLVDSLSVAENIFANQQPCNAWGIIQYDELYQKTDLLLQQLHLGKINSRTLVSSLPPAQKQMVEIAKALSKQPSIFILDEPTASLSENETRILFKILHTLKLQEISIIYISHRLEEIFLVADRISVLKDGKYKGTFLKEDITKDELIKCMVGRELNTLTATSPPQDGILFSVSNLTGNEFNDITFNLHKGEILGLAGLVGAGRTEIARALFGADHIVSGEIHLRNEKIRVTHPAGSISKGLAYVPEERKSLGLFPEMTIQDNIIVGKLEHALHRGLYNSAKAKQLATELVAKLRVATPGIQQKVNNLSGGNQQKVVLAKWLLTKPDVLIVDEPTHGIDVGAKFEIYEILRALAEEGKGIIIISSDLPELLGICHRIVVIKKGRVAGEISSSEATEEKIMAMASN